MSEIVCVREKKSVREEEGEKLLAENSVSFTRKTMILQRIIFFFFCRKGSRTSVGIPFRKKSTAYC